MLYFLLFFFELMILFLLSKSLCQSIYNRVYSITRSRKFSVYVFAVLFLPGTLVHELSHFITARLLLVPAGKMTLFPVSDGKLVKLGSVEIAKTDFIRRTIIGVSPFIIGNLLILGSLFFLKENSLFSNKLVLLLEAYLIFEIGNTMYSSKKDLEGTWVFLVFVLSIYLALLLIGVSIRPEDIFTTNVESILIKSDIFLLIPIIFDLVLVALLKFV